MNKREKISFLNKQLEISRQMKEVYIQNYNIATRLESEALTSLELLGNKPERSFKNKLSSEATIKLLGNLTKP